MAYVQMSPKAHNRFYLKPGIHGPGLDIEAECEVVEYQFPAETRPGWDQKELTKIGDFALLKVRVRTDEGIITITEHVPITANSGSKLPQWLIALGVEVSDEGFGHDTDDVKGRQCAVQIGEPRQDRNNPEIYYTGRIYEIFGV